MEILILVLLYYLSQKPDFHESVSPFISKLKNSEHLLSFLKDLSDFSKTFSAFSEIKKQEEHSKKEEKQEEKQEKNPQSPVSGIADEFIKQTLESYLKKS